VRLEDERAAEMLVEHLVSLGHRAIGFIGGDVRSALSQRREAGFSRALKRARLAPCPPQAVALGWEAEHGYRAVRVAAEQGALPSGLVVVNTNVAVGALTALRELGVAVPGSVSVAAVLDTWFARHTSPALTCAELPMRQLGRCAVQTLIDVLDGKNPNEVVVTEPAPRLIVRGSTGPVPAEATLGRPGRRPGRRGPKRGGAAGPSG
jgi:DNA-binding LacI/PurR family transcriptional regulator